MNIFSLFFIINMNKLKEIFFFAFQFLII